MAPNKQLEAVLTEYETFMHRLMATHAPEVNAIDITMAQAKALYVVLAAGQLRMSELAAGLGVTSSTATGLVDRLVDMGLLERGADPADRRQVVVTTTPAAESTLEHLRELNTRRMRELLGGMTSDDLAVVERAIAILSRALDADPASGSNLATPAATSAARRNDPQGDPS